MGTQASGVGALVSRVVVVIAVASHCEHVHAGFILQLLLAGVVGMPESPEHCPIAISCPHCGALTYLTDYLSLDAPDLRLVLSEPSP